MDDAQAKAALALQLFGGESAEHANSRRAIGSVLQVQGRLAEADQYLLDYIASSERHPPANALGLATIYEAMAAHMTQQMRRDDAAAWHERAISIYEQALPSADDRQLGDIAAYAQQLYWSMPERTEALYRAILARQEALPGSNDARNWMTLWELGQGSAAARATRRGDRPAWPGDRRHRAGPRQHAAARAGRYVGERCQRRAAGCRDVPQGIGR
jgi:tetratricopeptide (TPR) repeat protein